MSQLIPSKLVNLGDRACGATFGPLGIDDPYRYRLWRSGPAYGLGDSSEDIRWLTFIMLNPSKATHEEEDPTIRRCLGYARAWGFNGLEVLNLFALRSTDPTGLYSSMDPIGPTNDATIEVAAKLSSKIICAWGNHATLLARGLRMREMLKRLGVDRYALKETQAGQPSHPLYLRADLIPTRW